MTVAKMSVDAVDGSVGRAGGVVTHLYGPGHPYHVPKSQGGGFQVNGYPAFAWKDKMHAFSMNSIGFGRTTFGRSRGAASACTFTM